MPVAGTWNSLTRSHTLHTLHVTLPRHMGYLVAGPWGPWYTAVYTVCTSLLSWAVFKRISSFQDKIGILFWVLRLVPGARRGKNMSSYVSFGPHSSLSQVPFCTQMSSFIFVANSRHVSYSPFCVSKTPLQYTITHITLKLKTAQNFSCAVYRTTNGTQQDSARVLCWLSREVVWKMGMRRDIAWGATKHSSVTDASAA